ncbi:acyloxyacyl hydrolase [Nitrospira sp. Nam74]
MRDIKTFVFNGLAGMVFIALIHTPGFAEETSLIRIGPRLGLSGQTFLGKEQKYNFRLYDVAAVFRLPWAWPLGETPWKIETWLITSAGAISGAGETGLMATIIPTLALTSRNGTFALDGGAGPGFFSNYKFGNQDFGGPVQIVATVGVSANIFPHGYAGFRLQHFSDATLYGQSSLGVDMYLIEIGYRF